MLQHHSQSNASNGAKVSPLLLSLLLFFASSLVVSCQEKEPTIAPSHTYFPIHIGAKQFQLQLALTPAESQKGLMHRPQMDPQHGMVFVFKEAGPRSFWMKNTQIPLDLIYFDSQGQWQEKHALYPYDESNVPSISQRVQYAVELNQGEVSQYQLNSDTPLNLHDLRQAIIARGYQPQDFNIPSNNFSKRY